MFQKLLAVTPVALLLILLSACQPVSTETSAMLAEPEFEIPEEVVVALNQVPNDLCVTCNGTFSRRIHFNVVDVLIERDYGPDGNGTAPLPGIAESWEFASETELDLTIREGVKFHNGDDLTVEDVVFTLSEEKLWGEEPLTPDALAIGVFESVEALDDRTVRITTIFPDPSLISRLQSHIGRVIPKDYFLEVGVDGYRQFPIGTGPFMIESYDPREQITLVAFEDYYGPQPAVQKVVYRDVPELSTRVAGLINGEFDIIIGVAPQQFPSIETAGFRVISQAQENIQQIPFMSGVEELPVSDARVRRAMIHAINFDMLTEELYQGLVKHEASFQSPAHGLFYDPDREPLAYDPALAEELLAEAGYEGAPIKFQLISNNFVLVNEMSILLQDMWSDVGLKVQLDIIPDFTLHTLNPPTDVSMWSSSTNITMPDPFNPACTAWGSNSFFARGGRISTSDSYDSLCSQLAQTTDFEERKAIYNALLDVWDEESQSILLWQRPENYGVNPTLDWQALSVFGISFRPEHFPASGQ